MDLIGRTLELRMKMSCSSLKQEYLYDGRCIRYGYIRSQLTPPSVLYTCRAGIAETYALLVSGLCFSSRASSVPYDMLWRPARYSCLLAEIAMPSKDDDAKVYWQPHNRRRNRTTLNDVPAYHLPVASSAAQFSQSTLLNTCSGPCHHPLVARLLLTMESDKVNR